MAESVFALLTDFGLTDPYVAQMKSVLLSLVPGCAFLDISHAVSPQEIRQAGFFLAATYPYLPRGTICLAVVDPGVGTDRRIVLLEKQGKTVLAPDNGLLGLLLEKPGGNSLFDLTPLYPGHGRSATFHGRDVFAPLAADLAKKGPDQLPGRRIGPDSLVSLPAPAPWSSGPNLAAHVLHVDRFGNCILNLSIEGWASRFTSGQKLLLSFGAAWETVFVAETYARIPEPGIGLLQGSQGFFELACNQDSCAHRLGLSIGDRVVFDL